jgi:hypothetical protein
MTNSLGRRIFPAPVFPVSIAVLLLSVFDMKNVLGQHDFNSSSTGTFICSESKPCIHKEQQGNSVPSNDHGLRRAVDVPMISKTATCFDQNNPCPATGLFDSGTRPIPILAQASRQTILSGKLLNCTAA